MFHRGSQAVVFISFFIIYFTFDVTLLIALTEQISHLFMLTKLVNLMVCFNELHWCRVIK